MLNADNDINRFVFLRNNIIGIYVVHLLLCQKQESFLNNLIGLGKILISIMLTFIISTSISCIVVNILKIKSLLRSICWEG